MIKPSLVQVSTEDGLLLHGFFAPQKGKTALLHIHGFMGNFYENKFLLLLAEKLDTLGITFLSVNTRGAGKDTDFLTLNGDYKRVGGLYERLEDAYKDIDAWIALLLEKGYDEIILQGHSLGTVKAVRYLFEGKYTVQKLILLAPFDKIAQIEKITQGKWRDYVKDAKKKVMEGKGEMLVPLMYEDFMMSYQTFVSWYQDDDLSHMFDFHNPSYASPILRKIALPTKFIVGRKDRHFHTTNPDNFEEAMGILLKNIPHSEGKIIEDAHHSFAPKEEELVTQIAAFTTK